MRESDIRTGADITKQLSACPKCGNQWITTGKELRVTTKHTYWAYPQSCVVCGWETSE